MSFSFFGGVHPNDYKFYSSASPIQTLTPPAQVVIPMSMHTGAPCAALVKKGDKVTLGQKIADVDAPISAPIHSSISGTVVSVEPRLHPNSSKVMSIVIENDGLDTLCPELSPCTESELNDPAALIAKVREAGIVGMGGAAFPTHFKISGALGNVDTLIINAAECEPFITSDHRLLLEHPDEVLDGIRILLKILALPKAVLAIENNKSDAIRLLSERSGSDIEVLPLKTRYPQGSEKQLIQTVTGRQIPPGGLPVAVKCALFNAYTAFCIHNAIRYGLPAYERIITVSGPCVNTPSNFRVRVGTPIEYLFESAGGFKEQPVKILMGGPMMGNAQFDLSVPVIKGTNAVLALDKSFDKSVPEPVCIRCGRCADACPMHLMPLYLYKYERKNMLNELEKAHVTDCIECGACTYACPGRLNLTQSCRTAKQKLRNRK